MSEQKVIKVQFPAGNKVKTMPFSEDKLKVFLDTVKPKWHKIVKEASK